MFFFLEQLCSFLFLKSLQITSWVKAVLFCGHGLAEHERMVVFGALGLSINHSSLVEQALRKALEVFPALALQGQALLGAGTFPQCTVCAGSSL